MRFSLGKEVVLFQLCICREAQIIAWHKVHFLFFLAMSQLHYFLHTSSVFLQDLVFRMDLRQTVCEGENWQVSVFQYRLILLPEIFLSNVRRPCYNNVKA